MNPNLHLKPVFDHLLPALEKHGIPYWVYGGVSVAALKGTFIRKNYDVDVLVMSYDFAKAKITLNNASTVFGSVKWDEHETNWRQKLEMEPRGKGEKWRATFVTIKRDGDGILHMGETDTQRYPADFLEQVKRSVDGFEFFTTGDAYIKKMFLEYVTKRESNPRPETKEKIWKDAEAILSPEELELMKQNPVWNTSDSPTKKKR